MPIISKEGELLSPLFIVLQESDGKFGDIKLKKINDLMKKYKMVNIYPVSSQSGKMNKALLEKWFKEIYFPNVGEKTLLLLDSWNAHKDTALLETATPKDKNVEIMIIPEGTTGICQPLDVYGFS